MSGKKNIVFGFFYLVLTALLGPYMIFGFMDSQRQAEQANTKAMEELTRNIDRGVPASNPRAESAAILALNEKLKAEGPVNMIKGGPHAHGNLEALLNIVVGVILGFLVVGRLWKEIISWLFIGGTVLHSGMLYLGTVLHQRWAGALLMTGAGPLMLLGGLLLAGFAATRGLTSHASPFNSRSENSQ